MVSGFIKFSFIVAEILAWIYVLTKFEIKQNKLYICANPSCKPDDDVSTLTLLYMYHNPMVIDDAK